MALYYRDDNVRVTSESIQVGGQTYPIAELTYVWHTRTRLTLRSGSRILGRWVLVSLLTAPLGFGALCAVSALFADWSERLGAALIGLAAAAVLALALAPLLEFPLMALERSYDRGTAVHEIWVQHHGAETLLIRSEDALRFGQIYRAIQRAMEAAS
ncbi:DUF6232 family protein [Phytohabitans rumicis]|uniref:Uncharacterized protein n=1 Tax=Phytohabitans rumicis TaxID=1076125 RepID=A0A6V8KZH7_9ACTN|nr:DUF6232 family protein [Phytohabitans rumicis]GFJ89234.1 hypothetical protein Prum_028760 [Phytohabitans rumicis]